MHDEQLKALAEALKSLGVPDTSYSLGHPRNERTCLVPHQGKWLVYFAERGDMAGLLEFDTFEQAKANLLLRLL